MLGIHIFFNTNKFGIKYLSMMGELSEKGPSLAFY